VSEPSVAWGAFAAPRAPPLGTDREVESAVAVGTNTLLMPAETPEKTPSSWSKIVVYTRSTLAEATTPVATAISDRTIFLAGMIFNDEDLDFAEIGGYVTWSAPASIVDTPVTFYSIYFAEDNFGTGKSQVSGGTACLTLLLQNACSLESCE